MSDSIAYKIFLVLIKCLVCIYDSITYPVYYWVQKPWISVQKSLQIKAKQLNPKNPYSSWTCVHNDVIPKDHFITKCKTVSELFLKSVEFFGEKQCFGFRPILGQNEIKQSDGKIIRKQVLGDYQWFSYREVDERVENIASGLLWSGVRPKDIVLIFAETRLEWMLSCQAVFRMGATVATLYSTLGEDGIVHGINETKVTHCMQN